VKRDAFPAGALRVAPWNRKARSLQKAKVDVLRRSVWDDSENAGPGSQNAPWRGTSTERRLKTSPEPDTMLADQGIAAAPEAALTTPPK
jgi:hypothetical protein